LTFSEEDETGVSLPHDDGLVIKLTVANYDVRTSDLGGQWKLGRYIVLANASTNENQPRHDETYSNSFSQFLVRESPTDVYRYAPSNC
jgi:hypothetical protein